MLKSLLELRSDIEHELKRRTGGGRTIYPIYAFLFYLSNDAKFAGVLADTGVKTVLDKATGDDVLLFVVEPGKYYNKLVALPLSTLFFISIPRNKTARLYNALTRRSLGDSDKPFIIFVRRIRPVTNKRGKVEHYTTNPRGSYGDEPMVTVTLDAASREEYIERIGEVARLIETAVDAVAVSENTTPGDYLYEIIRKSETYAFAQKKRIARKWIKLLAEGTGILKPLAYFAEKL